MPLYPWTDPTTHVYASGETVSAATMNTFIEQNLMFLANKPSCEVYNGATLSIATGTPTVVTFNSERWDTDSMHSTSALTSRIVANTAGVYAVYANMSFVANATGNRYIQFRINGTATGGSESTPAATGTVGTDLNLSRQIRFNAGDYVEVLVFQDSGGALNLQYVDPYSPEFGATLLAF